MKKALLSICILFLPVAAFCDTLDYWHIYYNDDVIAKFNQSSGDMTVFIQKDSIRSGDLITLKSGDDNPCFGCGHYTQARLLNGEVVAESETDEFWSSMSFSLQGLLEILPKGERSLHFYYQEIDLSKPESYRFRFELIFI